MTVGHPYFHSGACSPLSRCVGRQPSTKNIDIPVPTLFTPAIDTSPQNETGRSTVEMSQLSPLGLTGIPPVDHELNSRAALLGFRPLPPLLEVPSSLNLPDKRFLLEPDRSQRTSRTTTASSSKSTSTTPSTSTVQSTVSLQTHSTSGTNRSRRLRIRLFGNKRSQTTPDTSPEMNSGLSLPDTSSKNNSSLLLGALAKPRRTGTMKIPASRSTRSATLSIDLPQNRDWEPVNPAVLHFMEMAANDSESLLRPAKDGTVFAGNLEGLVSRLINDVDLSRDDDFRAAFLTIHQLFATSERLFNILKRRFESSEFDLVAGRSRYPWVNNALLWNEY